MRYAIPFRPLTALALAVAIAMLVGAGGPATAPATEPALSPQDLQTLGQLETGSWRQRQSIQQQLIRRGVGDAPIIAAMLAHSHSPEARARLATVLKDIELAREMGGSVITMHFKNAPAKTVYAALFAQAWTPLKTIPANLLDSQPPISIDADREPFWAVMLRLQDATKLGMDGPAGAYALCRGQTVVPGPRQISGGFLVILSSIRPLVIGNPNRNLQKYFWLDLSIYPEPKLNVLSLNPQVKIDQATDDRGNALETHPEMGNIQNNIFPGGFQISICMKASEKNPGSHLARFHGTLTSSVALQWARFDIDHLLTAKPQSIDVDGLTLRFTGCQKPGPTSYQVSFDTPPDPQNRFLQLMQAAESIRVVDTTGHDMQCFSSTTSQNPAVGNTLAYTYGGQAGQAPAQRLIWVIPTVVRLVDIPVDFRDLNLDFINGVGTPPAETDKP